MSNISQCYFPNAQDLQKSIISVVLIPFHSRLLFRPTTRLLSWNSSLYHTFVLDLGKRFLGYNIIVDFCLFFFFSYPALSDLPIFTEFPMLWVPVGGKPSLSHLKQKFLASTAARVRAQDQGSVNQINPPYTWKWELETQRNRDIEELSRGMMVVAEWLNPWFRVQGFQGQ